MSYVDGFVLPVSKKKLQAYIRLAQAAGKIWRKHGALEYRECCGEDLATHCGVPFTRLAKAKRDETVVFSWIVYKSRAHRDRVMAKVMSDEQLAKLCAPDKLPFDLKRMSWGGFEIKVKA